MGDSRRMYQRYHRAEIGHDKRCWMSSCVAIRLQQGCDWIAERAAPGKGREKRGRGRKPRRKKQVIAIPTAVLRKLPASQWFRLKALLASR